MLRLVLLEDGPAMQVHDLERNGRREAMDFIESLAAPAQSRFIKTSRQLAQTGRAGREEQRFKHLGGPVYEVKEHSVNAGCSVSVGETGSSFARTGCANPRAGDKTVSGGD